MGFAMRQWLSQNRGRHAVERAQQRTSHSGEHCDHADVYATAADARFACGLAENWLTWRSATMPVQAVFDAIRQLMKPLITA